MKLWFYSFFMAWGMFLALPCPFPKWDEKARDRMLVCLPLIGLIVGGIWALCAWLAEIINCPLLISAFVLSVIPWITTGFIHLDGFMDVCDAVLSRRDLETRRKILKDPHCGAFAVICMVLLAACSLCLFSSGTVGTEKLLPLALIPASTRACAGIAVLALKPMNTSQYSSMDNGGKAKRLIPLIVMLVTACILPIVLCGVNGLSPAAAAIGYALFCFYAKSKLGGMSGDVSGYSLTLGELIGIAVLILVR